MSAVASLARGVLGLALALAVSVGGAAAQTAPRTPAAKSAPAQPAPAAPGDGDVVARVGARDVRAGEVRAYLAALPPRERAQVAADPAALAQAVRAYLTSEVVLAAALARKWEQRPDVAARLERARREALIESFLDGQAQPPADYPSEQDLQALYDANRTSFLTPRQFQFAQIFVAVPDKGAEPAARARLDATLARLRQPGAEFLAAADAAAGDQGADLGWVGEPQLRPEIREQVAGLAKGAVSPPIQLADGWHILKLIDTRPAGTLPLAEVRDQLVQRLRQERAGQLRRAALQDLIRQSPPAVNELALGRVLPAGDAGAAR